MKILKKILLFLFLSLSLFLSASLIFAQQEKRGIFALRINEPIVVDANLDEPAWKKAPEAREFILFKSRNNRFASENTSVKILYDSDFIYLGFLCYDPDPDKIEARVAGRDEDLRDEDSVYVLISPAHDTDNLYYYGTNVLGAQMDGKIALDDQSSNLGWNGIWTSAAQKTDFGWSAEIAIDLSSLKYEPKEEKTMNISLSRIIPRMLETSFWSGPIDPAFDISQLGQLKTLSLIKPEKKIKISPHLLSLSEAGAESWLEWGLDGRWAFSQLVSGHLALNPDFAIVEPDQELINLTRFELSLPEKRVFFLEGSEIYDQPIRLFYSKRIPDIYGGFKLNGSSGAYAFSAMSVFSRRDEFLHEDPANFSTARFKKNIGRSSSIGFLASNKLVDEKNRGAAGFDVTASLFSSLTMSSQFAVSYGNYRDSNMAFLLSPSYSSDTFHVSLSYIHLGRHFGDNVNPVGFIKDDNRNELAARMEEKFFIRESSLEQIQHNSYYDIYWGMDGTLRGWQIDQGLTIDLKNKFSFIFFHSQEFRARDDVLFEQNFKNLSTKLGIGFNTEEWEYATFFFSFGRNFGRTFTMLEVGKNLQMTRNLSVEFSMARLWFGLRHYRDQFVHMLKANYTFTRNLFFKLLCQTNTLVKKSNMEFLLTWRLLPPSGYIQLAYQIGRGRFGEKGTEGHTLLLDISYLF